VIREDEGISLKDWIDPMSEYTPGTIDGVRKILSSLNPNRKVETVTAVPLLGNTVAELCSLSIWLTGLVVIVPKHPERLESAVQVERVSPSAAASRRRGRSFVGSRIPALGGAPR